MGDPMSQEEIDKMLESQDSDGAGQGEEAGSPASPDASDEPPLTILGEADEQSEASGDPDTLPKQEREHPSVIGAAASPSAAAQPVQFGPLPEPEPVSGAPRSIDLLLDVKLQLTAELGRKKLTIKEALALGPGSVVELDKIAGEPVDVLVNGKLIARGEVVVIDENFGIRVTDVLSPAERMGRVA